VQFKAGDPAGVLVTLPVAPPLSVSVTFSAPPGNAALHVFAESMVTVADAVGFVPDGVQPPVHVAGVDADSVTGVPWLNVPTQGVVAPAHAASPAGSEVMPAPAGFPLFVTVSPKVTAFTVMTPDAAVTVHDPPPTDAMMLPEPADVGVTMIV